MSICKGEGRARDGGGVRGVVNAVVYGGVGLVNG